MKKLLTSLSLVLILAITVSAICVFAATIYIYDGYSFEALSDDYISICGWDNRTENLTIPAQLDGSYIKEIADRGLKDNTYITSVNFNPAIYMTRIGLLAFKGCTGLTGTVSLPNRLTEVGDSAFQDCSSITSVEYYAGSGSVPVQCFYNCASLSEVIIGDGVDTIDRLAFANCPDLTYVRIPSNVTFIHSSAFNGAENLVIYCYTDSCAHVYAEDKGIDYVLIDAIEPTDPPTEAPTDAPTEEPTQESTEEPTVPSTEAPTDSLIEEMVTFILGDADGNNEVEILDVTVIQRVLVDIISDDDGMIALRSAMEDGEELSITDATVIQRYLAWINVDYPVDTEVTRAYVHRGGLS